MGAIQDLLQEVPLSAVLRERVGLAEAKYNLAVKENEDLKQRLRALEEENASLRAQIPKQGGLEEDTIRVLVHFFRAEYDATDIGMTAQMLRMEKGVVKYHLDQLENASMAECVGFNSNSGHVYWALTPVGRKYAVENKLI